MKETKQRASLAPAKAYFDGGAGLGGDERDGGVGVKHRIGGIHIAVGHVGGFAAAAVALHSILLIIWAS